MSPSTIPSLGKTSGINFLALKIHYVLLELPGI